MSSPAQQRLSLLVVLAALLGAGAVTAFGGRSPADDVRDHAARSGAFARAECDERGEVAVAGRPRADLFDCWMSHDAGLGADDRYACFTSAGGRIRDVTDALADSEARLGCTSPPPPGAVVDRVVAGDRIVLDDGRRLRLGLVDAPDLQSRDCYAVIARDELRALLPHGTHVGLARDPVGPGARAGGAPGSAQVFARGRSVNLELVRRGAASAMLPGGDGDALRRPAARRLRAAARRARGARRGLWRACADTRLATTRPLATRQPRGMWIPARAVRRLPVRGSAWRDVLRAARELGDPAAKPLWRPDVADIDSSHDVYAYAGALAHVRTGDARYRRKVVAAIEQAMDSGRPSKYGALARGRNVVGYVLAADLVALRRHAPRVEARFRRWLRSIRVQRYRDGTMVSNHLRNANNHGTMTGAGRAAIAVYLGDADELSSVARVFRGWVGERAAYDGFGWGRGLSWQADPQRPVAVNPAGARRQGITVDGALPEEMRRGCDLRAPPCYSHYPWEGLGGALVQAELLYRQGYDAYRWGDRALLRAVRFLQRLSRRDPRWWDGARGPHSWEPWLVNRRYGTDFPATGPTALGKNMGWTDWTHAPRR